MAGAPHKIDKKISRYTWEWYRHTRYKKRLSQLQELKLRSKLEGLKSLDESHLALSFAEVKPALNELEELRWILRIALQHLFFGRIWEAIWLLEELGLHYNDDTEKPIKEEK